MSKYFFFIVVLFFMVSCGDSASQVDSESTQFSSAENSEEQPSAEQFAITNDFQDYAGAGSKYIYLTGNNGQNYIVPPTEYGPMEFKYVIMDIKVKGECIQVPAEAFPISVSVCESKKCSKIRPLDFILTNPAHYNISGIGGLLIPRVDPYSPCSGEYFDLIDNIKPYEEI